MPAVCAQEGKLGWPFIARYLLLQPGPTGMEAPVPHKLAVDMEPTTTNAESAVNSRLTFRNQHVGFNCIQASVQVSSL